MPHSAGHATSANPFTNIVLAMKVDPRIKKNIARVVGQEAPLVHRALNTIFQRDRIAADFVVNSGVPITVVQPRLTRGLTLNASDLERLPAALPTSWM
jgi:inosine-uridine nucleoside N-ribohydrolase